MLLLTQATEVKSVEPLRGMRLVSLDLAATKVTDLAPLAGMTTLERLFLNDTLVSSLDPVRGLPLKELSLDSCQVSDLSPLRGTPLERLVLRDTRVTDLRPLAGMPLKFIDLTNTPVLDFTPLAGLPLQEIHLQHNRVTDLGFVRGMPLRELSLWGCVDARNYEALTSLDSLELLLLPRDYRDLPEKEIASLAKLRTHPKLRQSGAEITDRMPFGATGPKEKFWKEWDEYETRFGPLRRAGVTFHYTRMEDGSYELKIEDQPALTDLSVLASIKDLPLRALWLNNCGVSDLTPIRGLSIRVLGLHGNPVADVRPLAGLPLVEWSLREHRRRRPVRPCRHEAQKALPARLQKTDRRIGARRHADVGTRDRAGPGRRDRPATEIAEFEADRLRHAGQPTLLAGNLDRELLDGLRRGRAPSEAGDDGNQGQATPPVRRRHVGRRPLPVVSHGLVVPQGRHRLPNSGSSKPTPRT